MLRLLELEQSGQSERPGSYSISRCAEDSVPLVLVVVFLTELVTECVVFLICKSLEGAFTPADEHVRIKCEPNGFATK